jgi:replication factor A2
MPISRSTARTSPRYISVGISRQAGDLSYEQVTFVGQVRNISTQATNVTYRIDDGTGVVEVKVWIDTDAMESSDNKPKVTEGAWARVWGKLRSFGNKRHVGAHVIRKIDDMNEVNYHLLEAAVVHCYFTKGPPEQFMKTEDTGGAQQQTGGQVAVPEQHGGRALPPMSANAKQVFNALKTTPQNNEGLHVQNIAAQLRMDVPDAMKAGDELLSLGVIFTTVDDDTWAILEF